MGAQAAALTEDSQSRGWNKLLQLLPPPQDSHNLLRPETMESLFVLWRVTRDSQYRRWGWAMLRAWERFCRVATGGYASLDSVLQVHCMQTLWKP